MFKRSRDDRARRQAAQEAAVIQQQRDAALRAFVQSLLGSDGDLDDYEYRLLGDYLMVHGFVGEDNEADVGQWPEDVVRSVLYGRLLSGDPLPFETNILVRARETAYWGGPSQLLKEVVDREYRGRSSGFSVPLGQGVRYRSGAIRGQLVTVGSRWLPADQGTLVITDQRVVFSGARKTLEFSYAKLVRVLAYKDAIDLGVSNRQATSCFQIHDPAWVAGMIRAAVQAVDGPRGSPRVSASQPEQLQLPSQAAATTSSHHDADPARWAAPTSDPSNWWPRVLRASRIPPLGHLLAVHPRADEWTAAILQGLTVEKLVLITNVQHNRCRDRSGDRSIAASERSWRDLQDGLRTMTPRVHTAWTGTVRLLSVGSEDGLDRVRTLKIGPLIGVCTHIISGPYAEARSKGIN